MLSHIGSGSFSNVFEGCALFSVLTSREYLGQSVIYKVMCNTGSATVENAYNEAQLMMEIDSHYVIKCYGCTQDDQGHPVIIMEKSQQSLLSLLESEAICGKP